MPMNKLLNKPHTRHLNTLLALDSDTFIKYKKQRFTLVAFPTLQACLASVLCVKTTVVQSIL